MKTEKEGNIFEIINFKQKIMYRTSSEVKVLKKCMFQKVLFKRKKKSFHTYVKIKKKKKIINK